MVAQRRQGGNLFGAAVQRAAVGPVQGGATGAVLQAVSFTRFGSGLMWTDAEREIDRKERAVRSFLGDMLPCAPRFPDITRLGTELDAIRDTPIAADKMRATLAGLKDIQTRLDGFSSEVSKAGMLAGDAVMDAFGKKAPGTKAGRIADLILQTLDMVPEVFRLRENNDAIAGALHPDIRNSTIGLEEQWLGESDVAFAKMRQQQMLRNLWALDERIRGDWPNLQQTFGLSGTLAHLHLTGSDLHKGGQQVVIAESSDGDKVVYKPRSVAPDAALLDAQSGVFASLNKLGAELPTMGFQQPKEGVGGYAEFVAKVPKKSVADIQRHYRQMGQLAVAAKLFGVNDLHYENIMAAARGPTIIDAETSFLLNVMTSPDAQATELQIALFTHVSVVDDKLSNNAFYTDAEEAEWKQRGKANDWDDFIGKKRALDVRKGGPYEAELLQGIAQMLKIVDVHRKKVAPLVTGRVDRLDDVRLVPLATEKLKLSMTYYRDYKRNDDPDGMDDALDACCDQVCAALIRRGYRLHARRAIRARLAEDFERGDIPVLHHSASQRQLQWNGHIVGKFSDARGTKPVVGDNIKRLVQTSAQQMLESLQR